MRLIELFKKEYNLFRKNKKQVLITILLPLFFSFIYLFMYSFSSATFDVTVCNLDSGQYSQDFISTLTQSVDTKVITSDSIEECVDEIESDITSGTLIGLLIESSFSTDIEQYLQPTIVIYFDNSKPNLGFFSQTYINNKINSLSTQVLREAEEEIKSTTFSIESDLENTLNVLGVLNFSIPEIIKESYNDLYFSVESYHNDISSLNEIDLEFLVNPINTQLIGIFEGENSGGFSFSVLYTVLNLFVILMLSSVSMVNDKKNNFLTRLKTSTTPIIFYILSKIIFFTIMGFLIFIPSFSVFLFRNAYFNVNILTVSVGVLLISTISTLIGSIIGLTSKDESGSIMLSLFVGFTFMLLSGLFYPVELLPSLISATLNILPTSFEIGMLNYGLIFNSSLELTNNVLVPLLIYSLILLIINIVLIIKEKD